MGFGVVLVRWHRAARRLATGDWLVGGAFSWADIAAFDWLEKWPASRAARRTWARGRRSWSIRGLQGSRCTYGGPGRFHVSITGWERAWDWDWGGSESGFTCQIIA